jgi:hypothetical protein
VGSTGLTVGIFGGYGLGGSTGLSGLKALSHK